jgi:competence protein ComEA
MKISIRRIALVLLVACSSFSVVIPAFAEKKMTSPNKVMQESKKSDLVNINTANVKELSKNLNGVGMKKAQAIIEFREANGDFKNLGDLQKVKGLGKKTVEKNMSRLSL